MFATPLDTRLQTPALEKAAFQLLTESIRTFGIHDEEEEEENRDTQLISGLCEILVQNFWLELLSSI